MCRNKSWKYVLISKRIFPYKSFQETAQSLAASMAMAQEAQQRAEVVGGIDIKSMLSNSGCVILIFFVH